jgi:hypothetical protein
LLPKIDAAAVTVKGLIDRAVGLEWELEKGFLASLADVPADEYLAMRVLDEERARRDKAKSADKQDELKVPDLKIPDLKIPNTH